MSQLTYEVFDGNPASSGPCGWDASAQDGAPDADDYTDPDELAAAVLEWALSEAQPGDYETGDRLWVTVYGGPDGNVKVSGELDFDD